MRLLRITNLRFQEFFDDDTAWGLPPCAYAILSHRWDEDELLYQQFLQLIGQDGYKKRHSAEGARAALGSQGDRPGVAKVMNACKLAAKNKLTWIWINTCCT